MNFNAIIFSTTLLLSYLTIGDSSSDISKMFETWCKEHNKTYGSNEEKSHRLRVFEENSKYVEKHNREGNFSYSLALNALADLTHREFKTSYLGGVTISDASDAANSIFELPFPDFSANSVPASIDWRTKGVVNRVKSQGTCNSCWAFTAAAAIESINKIVSGTLVSVSEQEMIDCVNLKYPRGCSRGSPISSAFEFVIKNHGIDTEQDYPYKDMSVSCNQEKLNRRAVTIDGYTKVPRNDEQALLRAVANQPVSVTICGSSMEFQLYNKDIFTGPCAPCVNHGLLIVGYGSENGKDYWIGKNSWGPKWGRDGYIYIQRNTGGDPQGLCGINMYPFFPVKTSPNPSPKFDISGGCGEGETCKLDSSI